MAVDYTDFLTSARSMLAGGDVEEVCIRNAMSRSYYGLYHIALRYADAAHVPPVSDWAGKTHEKLAAFYEGSFHANKEHRLKLRGIGYALKQSHRARCRADYHLDLAVDQLSAESQAISCERKSELIFGLMEALAA